MKTTVVLLLSIAIVFSLSLASCTSDSVETVQITTSAQCGMCKDAIEGGLSKVDGIIKSELNMDDNKVTVEYQSGTIDEDQIRKAIADMGYDADDIKGDPEAYAGLPTCCKKSEDRNNKE